MPIVERGSSSGSEPQKPFGDDFKMPDNVDELIESIDENDTQALIDNDPDSKAAYEGMRAISDALNATLTRGATEGQYKETIARVVRESNPKTLELMLGMGAVAAHLVATAIDKRGKGF